jgi:hypothetical protein
MQWQGADALEHPNPPDKNDALTSAEISEQVQTAVREVLALRELTRTTQMQTSRSQGYILKKLSPPVLARVAVILAEFEKSYQGHKSIARRGER